MRNTVKVGVIGAGFIGRIQIEAIRRTFLAEVVALASHDVAVGRQKASELGVGTGYGDYRDLIRDDRVEVVHICTPNNLHYPMAKAALEAGKHVVCEKPLTINRNEAEELLELAERKNLVHAVHFNVRYYPLVREAREMVRRGDAGQLFAVHGSYLQDWLFYDTDYSWRLEPEQSGDSRAIGDIGSHWLDLIEYITGQRVAAVQADFATFHPTRKKPQRPMETWSSKLLTADDYQEVAIHTEDYASVLVHFDGGARGVFTVNQVAAGHKNRVSYELNGSKLSLQWDSERPNEMTLGHREKANEVLLRDPSLLSEAARRIAAYPGGHNEGFPDTAKQLFTEIYRHILDRGHQSGTQPGFPTFYDGYRQVLLCEAIVRSARTRTWVEVSAKPRGGARRVDPNR